MTISLQLGLDNSGTAELDTYAFDFRLRAAIIAGDTLTGTPVVTFSPTADRAGAAALTVGAPAISGTQVQVTLSISGGVAGTLYQGTCTCQTAQGRRLIAYGNLLLVNPSQ